MGKIVLNRVDYRLAHGQVAYAWVTSTKANKIVILDKATVNDKLALAMMRASLRGSKVEAYDIPDGVNKYMETKFGKGNIIVIYRTVKSAYEAWKLGFNVGHLNVAQVPMEEGRKLACATVCLSDEEYKMLKEMVDAGVNVYCHQTPVNPKYTFEQIEKGLKGN
ncbi:MAG: PTS sugar transporter subunit IIB [Holdemanella sp.]|nr:PTS sugar transporter subunit IIB [Holdemanella sp.]